MDDFINLGKLAKNRMHVRQRHLRLASPPPIPTKCPFLFLPNLLDFAHSPNQAPIYYHSFCRNPCIAFDSLYRWSGRLRTKE